MTVEMEFTVDVGRPIGEVFDYVTNPANDDEWKELPVEVHEFDGEMDEGATWVLDVKMMGMTTELDNECTEFERPRRFGYRNTGSVATEGLYEFEEVDPDETRVTWRGRTEFSGFARILKPLIARRMKAEIKSGMRGLKSALEESEAQPQPSPE